MFGYSTKNTTPLPYFAMNKLSMLASAVQQHEKRNNRRNWKITEKELGSNLEPENCIQELCTFCLSDCGDGQSCPLKTTEAEFDHDNNGGGEVGRDSKKRLAEDICCSQMEGSQRERCINEATTMHSKQQSSSSLYYGTASNRGYTLFEYCLSREESRSQISEGRENIAFERRSTVRNDYLHLVKMGSFEKKNTQNNLHKDTLSRYNGEQDNKNDVKVNSEEIGDSDYEKKNSNEESSEERMQLLKDWEITETPTGKYYMDFKSSLFTMSERIRILEAALEEIRSRYFDTKDALQKFNRKYSRLNRKRRCQGMS